MKTIRVAIVGAGAMAREHARAFASLSGVSIAGVCSRSLARAQSLASKYGAQAHATIAEMHARTGADVVVAAVPELAMKEVAEACFSHPWVCLLEKPVGFDLAQAEAILARWRQTRPRCYVALNRRSFAATRGALAELAGDDSQRLIDVLDQQDMDGARAGGQPEPVVRNYMFANSIHLIDYFQVFGRGSITAVEVLSPWDPECPGIVAAAVRWDSGDLGLYRAVWNGPGPWAVSVTSHRVRLEMRPLERLGIQRRGERRLTEMPTDSIDLDFKPGLRYQAERIVAGLHGEETGLATLESATASMRLCARLYGMPGASEPRVER